MHFVVNIKHKKAKEKTNLPLDRKKGYPVKVTVVLHQSQLYLQTIQVELQKRVALFSKYTHLGWVSRQISCPQILSQE
jgi:hypothetical protein